MDQYKDIIRRHRPIGYTIERRRMTANDGEARLEMVLCISKEYDGHEALFILLHECGHVHMKHLKGGGKLGGPNWREEYEADQYAIKALRAEGIPVHRGRLQHQKSLVRDLIEQSDGSEHVDEEVLKYAYGRSWRKHR